jgi:riboflavin kinase/FMN adenylyltransferase
MKIIQDLHSDFEITGPVVFCLGVFDGVHRGHQLLIQQAKQLSSPEGSLVLFSLTQAPKFSSSVQKARRICTHAHKEKLLSRFDVDVLVHVPFTEELQNLSARRFLEYLNSKMTISHYVVGDDVSFGHNRVGNLQYLSEDAKARGQKVLCCEKIKDVSSTNIRRAIQTGKIDQASFMLGRPYSIYGSFLRNQQGVLYLEDSALCLPPPGVYHALLAQDLIQASICDNQLHLPSHLMHTYTGPFEIVFST